MKERTTWTRIASVIQRQKKVDKLEIQIIIWFIGLKFISKHRRKVRKAILGMRGNPATNYSQ